MTRKLANAVLGFVAGLFTAPFAVILWPFACAIFLYNESEDEI